MSKLKIEIKNSWTGSVLFEYEKENNTLKDTVEKAVKEGANLYGANLERANLEGAYLYIYDNEINSNEIIKNIESNSNLKIKETYINRNIIPTRWNSFWKYGLIICDWEIKAEEKEIKKIMEEKVERQIKSMK